MDRHDIKIIKELREEIKELKVKVSHRTLLYDAISNSHERVTKQLQAEEIAHAQTSSSYQKVMAAYILIRDAVGNVAVLLNTAGLNPNINVQPTMSDNFKGPC